MSQREAAQSTGISQSCVAKYLHKQIPTSELKPGRYKSVFTPIQEQEIVFHLKEMSEIFYGHTKKSLARLAYNLAEKNNIPHTFNKEKQEAGNGWIYGFMNRHPDLSMRTPEATSLARAKGFNRPAVNKFFNQLEELIQFNKLGPQQIFNVDETGFTITPKGRSKVIAQTGTSQVGSMTSCERGRLVTGVFCFSAVGQYVPPLFIFGRTKKLEQRFLSLGPSGCTHEVTKNGWINETVFVSWIHHFITHTNPTLAHPVLLILDNHSSHMSIEAIKLCRENHIILLSLPPHCSHRLQPLDVGFFYPLKTSYSSSVKSWMNENRSKKMQECNIPEIVNIAFSAAATQSTAVNSFRKSGIWSNIVHRPDRSVFSDSDFRASEIFPPEIPLEIINQHVCDVINSVAVGGNLDAETARENQVSENVQVILAEIIEPSEVVAEVAEEQEIDVGASTSIYFRVSPKEIDGAAPKYSNRQKRKGGSSEILTSSEFLGKLIEKKKKKGKENLMTQHPIATDSVSITARGRTRSTTRNGKAKNK